MTDPAIAKELLAANVRKLVMEVGHQRTAELLYRAADQVIAEGYVRKVLPYLPTKEERAEALGDQIRAYSKFAVLGLLVALIVWGIAAIF